MNDTVGSYLEKRETTDCDWLMMDLGIENRLGEKNDYQHATSSLHASFVMWLLRVLPCWPRCVLCVLISQHSPQFPICAQYDDQAGFAYSPGEPFRKVVNATIIRTTRASEDNPTVVNTAHPGCP